MKKTMNMVAAMLLLLLSSTIIRAQQTTWDAKKNPTVDSIISKYEGSMLPARPAVTTQDIFPVLGQYQVNSSSANANSNDPMSNANANTDMSATKVKISLDGENKGLVWVEGLPQGKIKAMLRKSPATYKIPAQKTDDGKDVAEGVLIYDKDNNTLNVCIGCTYNSADPATAFTVTPEPVVTEPVKPVSKKMRHGDKKSSTALADKVTPVKPWFFTGTKVMETTASTN